MEVSVPIATNVGHLKKEPTEITCPACNATGLSILRQEVVTCIQKIVAVINFCCCCTPIRWEGRQDFNHYCSKCGCFIGRVIQLSWYKRQFFKARRTVLEENMQWRNIERQKSATENQQTTEQSPQ